MSKSSEWLVLSSAGLPTDNPYCDYNRSKYQEELRKELEESKKRLMHWSFYCEDQVTVGEGYSVEECSEQIRDKVEQVELYSDERVTRAAVSYPDGHAEIWKPNADGKWGPA